jgi:AmmeMemoRadiSam system protein B/AmmeMemoRadiSam system protein A
VVAGQFYPADPAALAAAVDEAVDRAPDHPVPEPLLGLLVPHAGYVYSAQAAGHGYRALRGRRLARVVVLAPAHRVGAPYAATLGRPSYATPLGELPLDGPTIQRLRQAAPELVRDDERLFAREHSLEVQLPFLQRVLPGVPLVPLVLGDRDPGLVLGLARALHATLGPGDDFVVLASSDLSHYLPAAAGDAADARTLALVAAGDPQALLAAARTEEAQLCGAGPVAVLLELLRLRGGGEVRPLFHNHSGDASGDRARVVGYGVVAFGGRPGARAATLAPPAEYRLTRAEEQRLLRLARLTVEAWVTDRRKLDEAPPPGPLAAPGAAFVTLKQRGQLRGCIGHTEARLPLWQTVQEVARAAATEDPRFAPVRPAELPTLAYEISVLTPLQPLPDPREVRVGTDGLLVTGGGRRGLLLPQVPTEQGWDREQFLAHTCRKAGLPPDCWQGEATFQRFQALVFGEGD